MSGGTLSASVRLSRLTTRSGRFAMLALDHRDAFRNALVRAGVADATAETVLELKATIAGALAPTASGLLLDHVSVARCRAGGVGVLVPLEAQGHELLAGGRLNRLEFDVDAAMRVRADGCKLLLYYRPDHRPSAERQRELVVGAARDLARSGADVLKLQFPGEELCAAVDRAAAPLPWALLGGSDVDGDSFVAQVGAACRAGASGFIAGRAIWGGSLGLDQTAREAWLHATARPLLEQLVRIAEQDGRPYDERGDEQ